MLEPPGRRIGDGFRLAIQRCIDAGLAPHDDAATVTASLWGLHGIVALRLSKPGFPSPGLEELVDRTLKGLVGVRQDAFTSQPES